MNEKRKNTLYYFGSGFTWIDYLHLRKMAQNISDTITNNEEKNREIYRNMLSSSKNIENKLDRLETISEQGFEFLGGKLDTVIQVIDEWSAITVERLDSVIEQLNAIRKGIITPTQTKAFEHYNIGIGYVQKGLYDLAEEPLLEAEKLYKGDFLTQYALGELYLFGTNKDISVIDLKKAETHFKNAIRYAKIESATVPNANEYQKMSQYYAALSLYVQANEVVNNHKEEAKILLEESLSILKDLIDEFDYHEGIYLNEKIMSILNQNLTMNENLKRLIISDKNYLTKIDNDPDFNNSRENINLLFEELRMAAMGKFKKNKETGLHLLENYVFATLKSNFIKDTLTTVTSYNPDENESYFQLLEKSFEFEAVFKEFNLYKLENHIFSRKSWEREQNSLKQIIDKVEKQFNIYLDKSIDMEIINQAEYAKFSESFEECKSHIDTNVVESKLMFKDAFDSIKRRMLFKIEKALSKESDACNDLENYTGKKAFGCISFFITISLAIKGLSSMDNGASIKDMYGYFIPFLIWLSSLLSGCFISQGTIYIK